MWHACISGRHNGSWQAGIGLRNIRSIAPAAVIMDCVRVAAVVVDGRDVQDQPLCITPAPFHEDALNDIPPTLLDPLGAGANENLELALVPAEGLEVMLSCKF